MFVQKGSLSQKTPTNNICSEGVCESLGSEQQTIFRCLKRSVREKANKTVGRNMSVSKQATKRKQYLVKRGH